MARLVAMFLVAMLLLTSPSLFANQTASSNTAGVDPVVPDAPHGGLSTWGTVGVSIGAAFITLALVGLACRCRTRCANARVHPQGPDDPRDVPRALALGGLSLTAMGSLGSSSVVNANVRARVEVCERKDDTKIDVRTVVEHPRVLTGSQLRDLLTFTPSEQEHLQLFWTELGRAFTWSNTSQMSVFIDRFYQDFLLRDEAAKAAFGKGPSIEHMRALVKMLGVLVKQVNSAEQMLNTLLRVAEAHRQRGTERQSFTSFKVSFLRVVIEAMHFSPQREARLVLANDADELERLYVLAAKRGCEVGARLWGRLIDAAGEVMLSGGG